MMENDKKTRLLLEEQAASQPAVSKIHFDKTEE